MGRVLNGSEDVCFTILHEIGRSQRNGQAGSAGKRAAESCADSYAAERF
jgi:hypothetical protein